MAEVGEQTSAAGGISIAAVVPARDPAPGLFSAIEAALEQGGKLEQIVVVDDGLQASTRRQLANRFESSITIVPGPRRGVGAARNVGVRATSAEWVAFLDADDTWLPGHIEAVGQVVSAHPLAGACFGGALHETESGRLLVRFVPRARHANLSGLLRRRLQPTTSATAVSRRSILAVGGFFEHFEHPAGVEDIDLWWRIAQRFDCLAQPRPLVRYVVHQARDRGRSRNELARLARDRDRCIHRIRGEVPTGLFRHAAAKHHAVMARYWYLSDYRREGLHHSVTSLRWFPTTDGLAALLLGLLPASAREWMRRVRHRFHDVSRGIRG